MKWSAAQQSFDTWDQFQNLDYDRNGTLSRAEWHWSNASFTRAIATATASSRARSSTSPAARRRRERAAGSRSITVNSQHRWTDTGIDVRAGDVVTFNASGTIS